MDLKQPLEPFSVDASIVAMNHPPAPPVQTERFAHSSQESTQETEPSDSGPNVGAIAGGVVGGLIFIAVLTYLIWRFCIRNRNPQYDDEFVEEYEQEKVAEREYTPSQNARNSTHSVRSMASTALTRASNVIQIAFIPGITDRAQEDTHSSVPPVPRVPAEHYSSVVTPGSHQPNTPYSDSQDHYFMPHDLRESYFSTDSDRQSAKHQSVASSLARESVASTIYGEAQPAMPAQTALRGKANVVSVKSSQQTTPAASIPEVPQVDYFKYGQAKPRDGESKLKQSMNMDDSTTETASNASEVAQKEAPNSSAAGPASPRGKPKQSSAALTAAIQEATRRASARPTHGGLGSLTPRSNHGHSNSNSNNGPNNNNQTMDSIRERDPSPFSDENVASTPL
ncbi:MAG: hypothetical protein M1831_005597 [Alyxoria varia]|nr:MAG: hypothetical protein M1831_005597 [Alyxoria varia]